MTKLDGIDFGGSVEDKTADNSGDKLDTTPTTDEEKELQDKAKNAMENDISDDDIDADTSSDDSEDDSEEEDEDDESEDDSEEDSEEEESEEDSEVKTEEETKEDEPAKDADKESEKKSFLDNEVKVVEDSKLKDIESNESLNQADKDKLVMSEFLKINKDVIPESAITNFNKFIASGNDAFLHIDDSLHKLVSEVRKYRDDIPVSERLSSAFKIVFSDKLAKQEQKKGEVKAEIRTQKVNKSASDSTNSSGDKSKKSSLSDAQRQVFKKMGVKIPKKYN